MHADPQKKSKSTPTWAEYAITQAAGTKHHVDEVMCMQSGTLGDYQVCEYSRNDARRTVSSIFMCFILNFKVSEAAGCSGIIQKSAERWPDIFRGALCERWPDKFRGALCERLSDKFLGARFVALSDRLISATRYDDV